MKILLVEDDPTSLFIMQKMLEKEKHEIKTAQNGVEALFIMQSEKFDALLTDWMMPKMDGIELIRRVRTLIKPVPLIVVITSLSTKDAKTYALESGADAFIIKPANPREIISILKECDLKSKQTVSKNTIKTEVPEISIPVPYISVVIGASSGGPIALKKVFQKIEYTEKACFFVVLHGPAWMLETFSETLQNETTLKIILGKDGIIPKPGSVYIAPGNNHMIISCNNNNILLKVENSAPINYVIPAIDPLFSSSAGVFGNKNIGVVLTGMGCDGSVGAGNIARYGGKLIVQDPKTATVGSMPEKAIETGKVKDILPLEKIGEMISFYIRNM